MSGHALAARTLLAAADELAGAPPVEASAAALAGDAAGAWRTAAVELARALVRAVAESHGVAAVLFAATAAAAAAVDRGDPP
ncbi:type II toxin-antitoxin system antitoxin [Mycobacterium tuberculosis]|uniref:type II toxin-antitoxin system antitoxin n=5 Tax=Mycobacterium tuberculosis TaxID=1773 RepID=UPI0005DD6B80|nr:type II toxin-antitoxin system antitoxin [Mycobacterium tuberculosis]CMH59654.1 phiRv2 prophage protein [Mycobacterium tuberculosis]